MTYKLWIGVFCLAMGCVVAEQRDFQEQLEAAVIRTDLPKVQRLLTRKNKISLKRFNDMLGWANDTIEERRLLEPTFRERLAGIYSWYTIALTNGLCFCYYYNFLDVPRLARGVPGEDRGFKILTGAVYSLAALGLYKRYMSPRKRLNDAFSVLFAIEDTVDEIKQKKKKAQKKEG